MAAVNVITAIINLVPNKDANDGMKVKSLSQSVEASHALHVCMSNLKRLEAGERYRDFDEDTFEIGEAADYSNYYIASLVLGEADRLYDLGDCETYIKQYERLDLDKLPGSLRTAVLLEYLYYYIIHQPDFHLAKMIHSDRDIKSFLKKAERKCARVIAAYEFFVNHDQERGRLYLNKAKEFVADTPFEGGRAMENDRIKELEGMMDEKACNI